ncbi:MAG: hypothetical protein U5R31_12810 [Acidimicrobiia bacterium]|nr:hypothetical protein [Acidimicrobiia bacterium]
MSTSRWRRSAGARSAPSDRCRTRAGRARSPTAVVAVATGDGVQRIFHSLGVQSIVAGGQSMNPSTAQLLSAVESAPADAVVILPNNKNIIPVAEQVDAETYEDGRGRADHDHHRGLRLAPGLRPRGGGRRRTPGQMADAVCPRRAPAR